MKFCKPIILILSFLMVNTTLWGQNIRISGVVIDKETGEKVPFATVALYEPEGTIPLDGITTDLDGNFSISNIRPGDYRVAISFMGYDTHETEIGLPAGEREKNLGTFALQSSLVQLEETEVAAMARSSVNRLDRISYRAEDFETARGGTAAELLGRLPSLTVSPEGEISLRGTTDFIVYLNGRPTQLEPSVLLAQIPASSIVGVDIITVPTAGFDAQGKGGIINITTKAQLDSGLSVSANGTFGSAPWGNRTDGITGYNLRDDRYGGALNLVYAQNGWLLQGGLNYNERHVNSDRSGVARIRVPGTGTYKHMIASGMKPEWYDNFAANFGFERNLSPFSQISGSYFYGKRTEGRIANYLYNNFFGDMDQNPIPDVPADEGYTFNPNKGLREGSFNTLNLDYSLKPDDRQSISLGVVYEYSVLAHDVDNPNIIYHNDNNLLGEKILHYRQEDRTPLHGFRLSADYSRDLGENYTMSLGFQPQYVNISGGFDYDTLGIASNQWGTNTAMQNDVELNRFIYAGYVDLAGQISKLNFKAGLRLEYTDQTLEIENPDYFSLFERPAQREFNVNQPDLFPSLHAVYPVSNNDRINLAASRRISRAPVKNMAPFLYRRHLEVYVVGDPQLKPEYINTAELTYTRNIGNQQVSLTGFYRDVTDAVFRVNTVFDDELILIRTFTNAGQTRSLGAEVNANFELGNQAKFYLGASLYDFRLEADIFEYREDHRSTNWNLKGNTNILLGRDLRFVADFNVRSAEVTAQGSDRMRYIANAAMVYTPRQLNGWSFNLRALNILNSNTTGISTRAYNTEGVQIFYQDTDFYWYGPVAELTISYQFNWRNQTRSRGESSFGRDEF
jgi:outer membrane receptor protein involved in Fe transport